MQLNVHPTSPVDNNISKVSNMKKVCFSLVDILGLILSKIHHKT